MILNFQRNHPLLGNHLVAANLNQLYQMKKVRWKKITINYSQCGKNEEDGEIDLDDDSQVVLGEGVGKVGDEDEHGGGQVGGE